LIAKNISVIPKTEKPARLPENFKALSLKLSAEDLALLESLNRDQRIVDD
jgi:diketogulonate reductase-like aldo/keto reductase